MKHIQFVKYCFTNEIMKEGDLSSEVIFFDDIRFTVLLYGCICLFYSQFISPNTLSHIGFEMGCSGSLRTFAVLFSLMVRLYPYFTKCNLNMCLICSITLTNKNRQIPLETCFYRNRITHTRSTPILSYLS